MAKKKPRTGEWLKDEVKQLKKIYRNMSNTEVAKELNRTVASVRGKASSLGLTKTKKYLKSIGRG